jgi:hypothetical protein
LFSPLCYQARIIGKGTPLLELTNLHHVLY